MMPSLYRANPHCQTYFRK